MRFPPDPEFMARHWPDGIPEILTRPGLADAMTGHALCDEETRTLVWARGCGPSADGYERDADTEWSRIGTHPTVAPARGFYDDPLEDAGL